MSGHPYMATRRAYAHQLKESDQLPDGRTFVKVEHGERHTWVWTDTEDMITYKKHEVVRILA